MCVGNLFKPPSPPPAPPRMKPAPSMRPAAPPPETVRPEDIKEVSEEDKIETRKKKALEIKKVKEGVKEFGAIDAATMPQGPEGGVNIP